MVAVKTELEYEQAYVSILYQRLDTLRVRAAERVAQVLGRAEFGGTYQGRLERDALVTRYRDRLAQLWSAETGLCFGRLDLADGTRRYIGRLGLADDDRESLLVDWRAPAARPFYRATPAGRAGWATSSPPSRRSRTASSARTFAASWWWRVARARARPPWRCTGPPTCSTRTASGWPGGVCWWSGRTRPSCATSSRCCRRWGRPACCWPPPTSCTRA